MFFSVKKGYGEQARIENILQTQIKMETEMAAMNDLKAAHQNENEDRDPSPKFKTKAKQRRRLNVFKQDV